MLAAPAKQVPTYTITLLNLPPPTSNPVRPLDSIESDRIGESAVEMGVESMLPIPLVNARYPKRLVTSE